MRTQDRHPQQGRNRALCCTRVCAFFALDPYRWASIEDDGNDARTQDWHPRYHTRSCWYRQKENHLHRQQSYLQMQIRTPSQATVHHHPMQLKLRRLLHRWSSITTSLIAHHMRKRTSNRHYPRHPHSRRPISRTTLSVIGAFAL